MKSEKTPIDIGICDGPELLELSVSKAKRWRQCQKSFDYKYVDKLKPKRVVRPLTLGSLVHKCLETRAKGMNWVQVIKDFKENEWSKIFEEEKVELGDIPTDAYRIMRGYHYYYLESDKRYRTVAAEVPFRMRIEKTNTVIVGIIDLIVEDSDGGVWCIEHKTVKKDIPSEDYRMTDVQTTIYIMVMRHLGQALGYDSNKVKGILMDYLKTTPPTVPEVLKNGTLSKRKIKCDRYTYLDCIKEIKGDPNDYTDILEYMDTNIFYRRIPISRSPAMEKNVLKDMIDCSRQIKAISGICSTRNTCWTCDRPKCEYRDLCIADLQGFDTSTLISLNFEKTNKEEEEDGENESTESE